MTNTHHGYIAGRYRDGALSDTWTDVRRCAERTFITYHHPRSPLPMRLARQRLPRQPGRLPRMPTRIGQSQPCIDSGGGQLD
jgi:hypothetical protein